MNKTIKLVESDNLLNDIQSNNFFLTTLSEKSIFLASAENYHLILEKQWGNTRTLLSRQNSDDV